MHQHAHRINYGCYLAPFCPTKNSVTDSSYRRSHRHTLRLYGDSHCSCLYRLPWVAGDHVDRRLTGAEGTEQDCVRSPHRRQDITIVSHDRIEKYT